MSDVLHSWITSYCSAISAVWGVSLPSAHAEVGSDSNLAGVCWCVQKDALNLVSCLDAATWPRAEVPQLDAAATGMQEADPDMSQGWHPLSAKQGTNLQRHRRHSIWLGC